jgi:NifU-like protein involved in Fe-S cluster formation
MSSALYTHDILRLAMALPADDSFDAGTGYSNAGHAERRSVTCGSVMTSQVALDAGGRITGAAFRANACALGQASAAVLRSNAAGMDKAGITAVRAAISEALSGEMAMPEIWPELMHFTAAKKYPARHPAILLPYDALIAAMENALEMANHGG